MFNPKGRGIEKIRNIDSRGLQPDTQNGDFELAADPLEGIALLSKGIVIIIGLNMPLVGWLCVVRMDG